MYSAQCGDTVALILKVVVFSNGGRYIGFSHISVGIVAQASVLAGGRGNPRAGAACVSNPATGGASGRPPSLGLYGGEGAG